MKNVHWLVALALVGCTGGGPGSDSSKGSPSNPDVSDPSGPTGPTDPDTNVDPATVDSDGDGLTDQQEIDLGTDPQAADSDDDRLQDGAEVDASTDPLNPDSDGDSYADGDEVNEGTDPLDEASVIYLGGWPYDPFKDQIADPGFSGAISMGGVYPDLIGIDQFGQEVHLYDFAESGEPVVVDLSTVWCPPCNAWADYLAGIDTPENAFVNSPNIRDAIESGELHWVTVLLENVSGGQPSSSDSINWSTVHPDESIPVLIPGNPAASEHFGSITFYPTMVWLNDDMTVHDYDYFESNGINIHQSTIGLEAELGGN